MNSAIFIVFPDKKSVSVSVSASAPFGDLVRRLAFLLRRSVGRIADRDQHDGSQRRGQLQRLAAERHVEIADPATPLETLIIKVLQVRHPKRNPFLRPFWVLSFLSPLKQFAEEGSYGRKYLRLPKKAKGNRQ